MNKSLVVIIVSFGLLWANYLSGQQTDWKLEKSDDGVKVYTKSLEGGKIKQFRTEVNIRCTIQDVIALLERVERFPEWQDNCDHAHLIERIDGQTFVARYTSDTPWPFSNRDIVLQFHRESKGKGKVVYTLTSLPNSYPEQSDYVRIKEAGGEWTLEEKGGGELAVTYEFYADPAGNIPKWLVNMFIVQGPFNSMVRMRDMLE